MSDSAVSAETVLRFYQAVAARDMASAQECFTPDAVWHLPGRSVISGEHRGWEGIRDGFLARLGPLSGGTFRAELLDITIGHDYVVAVQHATANYQGRHLDITGCQLMTVRDGLIAEVRGHYSDERALDAFWGAG